MARILIIVELTLLLGAVFGLLAVATYWRYVGAFDPGVAVLLTLCAIHWLSAAVSALFVLGFFPHQPPDGKT